MSRKLGKDGKFAIGITFNSELHVKPIVKYNAVPLQMTNMNPFSSE